ncbi:hypothetical protein CHU92_00240, partial [Flavobacterium cyanobacteriorum]
QGDEQRNLVNNLSDYLDGDNYSNNSITFVFWGINYLLQNPDVTYSQFKNWFLTPREGNDFIYDAAYWEDPNLSFPQQDLPSWEDFQAAYPTESSEYIYDAVGGELAQLKINYPVLTRNGCALKVSRALNYSGVIIPDIPGTFEGADGKFYFVNAKALDTWMKETFGTNPATVTTPYNEKHYQYDSADGGVNGGNFKTLLSNKKGIYTMLPEDPAAFQASGHCDIFDGVKCKAGCYYPAASEVNIWVLE